MKVKEYIFRETGEVRPPQYGEWYVSFDGIVQCRRTLFGTSRTILKREDPREVEAEPPVPEWIKEAAKLWNETRSIPGPSLGAHFAEQYRRAKKEGRA